MVDTHGAILDRPYGRMPAHKPQAPSLVGGVPTAATWGVAVAALLGFADAASAANAADLYIQTGTDPTWQQLLDSNAIPIGTTSTAGVQGSAINVNNSLVEVGPNKNNTPISGLRIHTLGNSSVLRGSFGKWSRWYQEDGNTQVFRLFKDEVNVQNDRPNAARIESFYPDVSWAAGDGWFKWQGTYTIIKPLGAAVFQAKNSDNDWSVQINTNGNGDVTLNHRTGTDQVLATNMVGQPFDITVYDNGTNYMVYMDDQYAGYGSFSRPTGSTVFRWGMYVGDSVPARDAMLFVTGAKISSNVTAPPKLSAAMAAPSRVIRGTTVSGTLSVSNSTPVTSASGAARLDYAYTSSGLFSGSGTGSDMALGGANAHVLTVNTATTGLATGLVSATATSPMTATPTFSQTVSVSVLDHAIGSFASGSTLTNIDIDFGTLPQGTGTASRSVSIFNRTGSAGGAFTANLDLDAITANSPGVFSTTLAPFANLASGSSRTFSVLMLPTTTGVFSGTYSLNLSDEDVPGATSQSLSLTVRGIVAPGSLASDWTPSTGGSWLTGSNWSAGVPSSNASVATIGSTMTAPTTITLDAPINLNVLSYAAQTGTIAAGNGGSLIFGGTNPTVVVSSSLTITAPLAGGFIKNGLGTLFLTGSNASGTIRVAEGGLDVTNTSFAGPGRTYAVAAGAVLSLSGTTTVFFGTTGTTTLSGDGVVRVNQGTTLTSPNTTGHGDIAMQLGPTATLEVNGVMGAGFSTGRGVIDWTNNRADLSLGPAARFNAQTAPNVFVDALLGSGSITKTSTGSTVLTIGIAGGSGTFAGLIANPTGSISLVKAGSGTQVLTAANTYTGPTSVTGGTLRVNGDHTAATGAVTVSAGATLAGVGTVGGATTIQSGATLAPGSSPGTLTFAQGLTFAAGGNYDWQISDATGTAGAATGWDLATVRGVLSVASTSTDRFNINLGSLSGVGPDVAGDAANFNPTASGTWRIASATGGITGFAADKFAINVSAINGTGGFTNALCGGGFSLVQSGNDLNLVFTPFSGDLVLDVPAGTTMTQADLGFPLIATASSLTKTGGGTLVLDAANAFTGMVTVRNGTLSIAAAGAVASSPVTVQAGGILRIEPSVTMRAPSLTLAGGQIDAAGATILVNGTGTGIGQFVITSGTVSGAPGLMVSGGGFVSLPRAFRQTIDVSTLSIDQDSGGKIDIGTGRITIQPGGVDESALRADLIAGRNGGPFNGVSGIMTTGGTAGGAATAVVGYRVFTTGSAIVAWAAFGDTNLDGQVNLTDINLINTGNAFGQGSSTGATWSQGDFNYSGGVTLADINLLNTASRYLKGSYLPQASLGLEGGDGTLGIAGITLRGGQAIVAETPEPSTWLLALMGVAALVRRRR